jgi:hypothetical protein
MTNRPKREDEGTSQHGEHGEHGERAQRRPYRAPSLRRLGSVRELTLGGTMGMTEGGGGFFPPGQSSSGGPGMM